jgi:hypothetical protein
MPYPLSDARNAISNSMRSGGIKGLFDKGNRFPLSQLRSSWRINHHVIEPARRSGRRFLVNHRKRDPLAAIRLRLLYKK